MTCSYCGSHNDELESRCRRCGRKPEDTLNPEFTVHRTQGALATKLRPSLVVAEAPTTRPSNLAGAVQGSLFTPNVIAMPNRMAPRPPRPRAAAGTGTGKPPVRRAPRPAPEGQGEFEFFEPAQTKTKTLGTTVDAVIYCEAPVATPLHRAVAAAIDLAMIFVGYGLFLMTFLLCGGAIVVNRPNLLVFAGALGLIAATYGLFWTIAGTESVGMRAAHLRLITFGGFTPDGWQRVTRLAGMCLSPVSYTHLDVYKRQA